MAAEINAQLEVGAPSALGFESSSILDLRHRPIPVSTEWDRHEVVFGRQAGRPGRDEGPRLAPLRTAQGHRPPWPQAIRRRGDV